MLKTRFEDYTYIYNGMPFQFNIDIERSNFNKMEVSNWHENLEIQLCNEGEGTLLLDGRQYPFRKKEIYVVNSNLIHCTNSSSYLKYSALIISASFCRQMGIDYENLHFTPHIINSELYSLLLQMQKMCLTNENFKTAKLTALLLQVLIIIAENYSTPKNTTLGTNKSFKRIKDAIQYIRENYDQKILLDDIAKSLYTDKFSLSREFKKATGKTIVEYINDFRCQKAAEYIISGCTVTEAARMCGYLNLSFFTRTFKKCMGELPSEVKKHNLVIEAALYYQSHQSVSADHHSQRQSPIFYQKMKNHT